MKRRYVLPMTRQVIIGWPEKILFLDTPDESFLVTRFYINAPSKGFCLIERLLDGTEFSHEDLPMVAFARLPGAPVDPHVWMQHCRKCRITPRMLSAGNRFRIQLQYTGSIPPNMKAGDTFALTLMLIGRAEFEA